MKVFLMYALGALLLFSPKVLTFARNCDKQAIDSQVIISWIDNPMDPQFKKFLDEQGIPPPEQNLTDEKPPEPVSAEKIRAFRNRELSGPEAELIAFYVSRYRAWHEADLQMTGKEQRNDGKTA